ncbi:MAG: hypothetical protein ISS27_01720 [Candidatus Omnitrophica bacterium]|nr:hypothetical protein [Candidatus Omnitrophota bacterium]
MTKLITRVLTVFSICLILGGCILLPGGKRISRLQGYSANRDEIEVYVEQQEALYSKLKADINSGVLRPGITKHVILERYSDPIFCNDQPQEEDANIAEICLFRHPTAYFTSDKIYLHFDKNYKLCAWQVGPVQ